jgi:hypothetical protein
VTDAGGCLKACESSRFPNYRFPCEPLLLVQSGRNLGRRVTPIIEGVARIVLALLVLAIAGGAVSCGGSKSPSQDHTQTDAERPHVHQKPTRPHRACKGLPGATEDSATDLTGQANTSRRVNRVRRRHDPAIWRYCRGVNEIGTGDLSVDRDIRRGGTVTPSSVSDKDHYIEIGIERAKNLPVDRRFFLDGVPVHVKLIGTIRPA